MGNFFKTLGKGILYFITLPLLVLFLAVYLVISVFGFIIVGIKGLILFFKGENITGKTKEDIEAEEKLNTLIDPISSALKGIEQAQAENKTPILSVDENDKTLKITAIPNQNKQIQQDPVQLEPLKDLEEEKPIIKEEKPVSLFEEEPEEVKETKVVEFKKPDENNIISEENLDDLSDINTEYNNIEINHIEPPSSNYDPYSMMDDEDDEDENKDGVSFQEYLGDDDK